MNFLFYFFLFLWKKGYKSAAGKNYNSVLTELIVNENTRQFSPPFFSPILLVTSWFTNCLQYSKGHSGSSRKLPYIMDKEKIEYVDKGDTIPWELLHWRPSVRIWVFCPDRFRCFSGPLLNVCILQPDIFSQLNFFLSLNTTNCVLDNA